MLQMTYSDRISLVIHSKNQNVIKPSTCVSETLNITENIYCSIKMLQTHAIAITQQNIYQNNDRISFQ